MNKELATLAKSGSAPLSVPMPGGVWTRTGFVVFDAATEQQLCRSVSQMNALNLSSAWALGDLGIAIQARKLGEFAKEAKELRGRAAKIVGEPEMKARLLEQAEELETTRMPQYTRDLAEALGVDDGYWRNCVQLARFYEPSQRCDSLSPHHHRVAMIGAGGMKGSVATAQQWIAQATKDALTASELRKKVNLSLATSRPPTKPPETNPFTALDAADQWVIGHRDEVINPAAAALFRTRWAALIEFIERLKNI